MNRLGSVIVVAAAAALTANPVWCQYDRAVLPLNRVHVRVDSATGVLGHRLKAFRLEGSGLGKAEVLLSLLRVDRSYKEVTSYQVTLTITDTLIWGLQRGSIELVVDGKAIHLFPAGGDVRILPASEAPESPPLRDRERIHGYFEEVEGYTVSAEQLIALALGTRIEVRITSRAGQLTRSIKGGGLDQLRGFVVYYVEGAPQPHPPTPSP